MKFAETHAALPPRNAETPRRFSCTKRIKTDFRNKLSVGRRLQDLLMISRNEEDRPDGKEPEYVVSSW